MMTRVIYVESRVLQWPLPQSHGAPILLEVQEKMIFCHDFGKEVWQNDENGMRVDLKARGRSAFVHYARSAATPSIKVYISFAIEPWSVHCSPAQEGKAMSSVIATWWRHGQAIGDV
ncbi:hypothetical protein MUK42_34794 [Musa troglodytarum]|uniref:Uncharacterized protein n=1 Tax=Musa troglodytarum TaxID=320322 RepID=A0A9E7G5B3_9LILI|nr:hypothetical protein MUK42_34794 [Musa troglodytarum]